jgi:hypothetical protein
MNTFLPYPSFRDSARCLDKEWRDMRKIVR